MLGTLMSSVFSDEVAAWQDARRAGASLGDHLVAELDREPSREGHDPPDQGDADTQVGRKNQGGGADHDAASPQHDPDAWDDSGVDLPTTVLTPHRTHAPTQPVPVARRWPLGLHWPFPRSWLWVIAAAVVALCAAGWLVSTVLHD
jgi:hypothetical protein